MIPSCVRRCLQTKIPERSTASGRISGRDPTRSQGSSSLALSWSGACFSVDPPLPAGFTYCTSSAFDLEWQSHRETHNYLVSVRGARILVAVVQRQPLQRPGRWQQSCCLLWQPSCGNTSRWVVWQRQTCIGGGTPAQTGKWLKRTVLHQLKMGYWTNKNHDILLNL